MKARFEYTRRSKSFPKDFSVPMARIASMAVATAQRRIKNGIPPENSRLTQDIKSNALTLRDSGLYLASIAPSSGTTWAKAGTKAKQGRMLQEGGVIRPRRAKSLAIPAGRKTRTLMRRYGLTPRACIAGMEADGYKTYVTPLSKVLWAKKGKTGKPFPLFILRKEVKIPPRPHLFIDAADEIVYVSIIEGHLGYRR